jgi:hypothetical protein
MTGTPSKDRAEAHMAVARELALSSEGIYRAAEFEALARDIAAALDKAFAEGMKRATDALDKYRASLADIPLGHENPQRGASTYNWKVAVFEEIRDAINREIGET